MDTWKQSKNCLLGSKELQWWCGQCFVASYKWPSWERPAWRCMGFQMLVHGSWRCPDGLSPMRSKVPWFLTERTGSTPRFQPPQAWPNTTAISVETRIYASAMSCIWMSNSQIFTNEDVYIGYKFIFTLNLSRTNPVFVPANSCTVV